MEPLRIFIAYSHKDEELRDQLEVHMALLKRQGYATIFHDRRIVPGMAWEAEIDAKLLESDVILLLISADFLASDYCYGVEMQTALELREDAATLVIPVILRPCDWQEEARLAGLQALPRDAIPVTTWENRDEAFVDIARRIREVLQSLGPKAIATDLVMAWSPSAMVAARLNRMVSGSLPRVPASVILVMPDQGIIGDSLVAAVVLTDAQGRPAEGVPLRLELNGGAWGAPVGRSDLPVGTPINATTGTGGVCLVKIFAEAPEVFLVVEAQGFPKQVGRFVAGAGPPAWRGA